MGPYDTVQDKSFVVYETIRDLEKMDDLDWVMFADFTTVYVVNFGSL
jgi:hypothetical protein